MLGIIVESVLWKVLIEKEEKMNNQKISGGDDQDVSSDFIPNDPSRVYIVHMSKMSSSALGISLQLRERGTNAENVIKYSWADTPR